MMESTTPLPMTQTDIPALESKPNFLGALRKRPMQTMGMIAASVFALAFVLFILAFLPAMSDSGSSFLWKLAPILALACPLLLIAGFVGDLVKPRKSVEALAQAAPSSAQILDFESQTPATESAKDNEGLSSSPSSNDQSSGTALVADADDDQAKELQKALRKIGWNCQIATSTEEVLSQVGDSVDVVFLDNHLDGRPALELLREIRETAAHTEVVMVSGSSDAPSGIEAFMLGASEFLSRPLDKEKLAAAASRAIAKRRGLANGEADAETA